MNNQEQVAEKVKELGQATAYDLQKHLPHLAWNQIDAALKNARRNEMIKLIGRTVPPEPGPTGAQLGIYGPPDAEDDLPRGTPFYKIPGWVRPPVSVFELGDRA